MHDVSNEMSRRKIIALQIICVRTTRTRYVVRRVSSECIPSSEAQLQVRVQTSDRMRCTVSIPPEEEEDCRRVCPEEHML
jgi:hypothetical protein